MVSEYLWGAPYARIGGRSARSLTFFWACVRRGGRAAGGGWGLMCLIVYILRVIDIEIHENHNVSIIKYFLRENFNIFLDIKLFLIFCIFLIFIKF